MRIGVKIILAAMGTLVVAGIAFSSISADNKIKKIKSHPKQTVATVFDKFIPQVTSSGIKTVKYQSRYKYEFEVDGKKYEALSDRYNFLIENQNAIMNKRFPVIFDETDPENSCILILQRDYEPFNLQQPDSLKHYEEILN
jgi:hypothetical protein